MDSVSGGSGGAGVDERPPVSANRRGPIRGHFDPEKHCGTMNVREEPCKRPRGAGTDHLGEGSCSIHGGIVYASKKTAGGVYTKFSTMTLLERAAQVADSDELLSVDKEIAYLKAVAEKKMEQHSGAVAEFEKFIEDCLELGQLDDRAAREMLTKNMPTLDLAELETMHKLVRTTYDMRWSRRFSVPVAELAAVFQQIKTIFEDVCDRYRISPEAKTYFAVRMAGIKLSRPVDFQLNRAGGVAPEDVGNAMSRAMTGESIISNTYDQEELN